MTRPVSAASGRASAAAARSSRPNRWLQHRAVKPVVFAGCLLPFLFLLAGALGDGLGPNPAETLIRSTGDWTLRCLLLTLAITPLRQLTGWHALARLRRMLGLFTFFYALWHVLAYAWLDMGLDPAAILNDIGKRPFILVGTTALLLMLPLALTSFNAAIRTLGAARWQALHRAVYAIGLLAILHFFWMRAGKNLFAEVAVHALILATLLGWRWWRRMRGPRLAG
jgi:sulfoxide reductase heme-binding subunit YedZ